MGRRENFSLKLELPTNKCRRNNGIFIVIINSQKKHQWVIKTSGQKFDEEQDINTKYLLNTKIKKKSFRTSLVVQWLRIRLPRQRTQLQTLVQEDPTCRGATKLVCRNY